MVAAVNQSVASIFGVYNAMVPKEGPKIIPVSAQLLAPNTSVLLDFSSLQQQGKISFIQGVMVDNSGNASPLTIQSQTMNQKIVIPAGAQAILPLFVTNPPVFLVSSVGGVQVPLFFFNIPLPAQVWNAANAFTFTGGSLVVSDPLLEALISNLNGGNGLNVNIVSGLFAGPNNPSSLLASVASTGAATINGTAVGGGLHCYLTGFDLRLTGNAALLAAAEIPIQLQWLVAPNALIWSGLAFVPTAAPASALVNELIGSADFTVPLKSPNLADSVRVVIGGVALTAGHFILNAQGFSAA